MRKCWRTWRQSQLYSRVLHDYFRQSSGCFKTPLSNLRWDERKGGGDLAQERPLYFFRPSVDIRQYASISKMWNGHILFQTNSFYNSTVPWRVRGLNCFHHYMVWFVNLWWSNNVFLDNFIFGNKLCIIIYISLTQYLYFVFWYIFWPSICILYSDLYPSLPATLSRIVSVGL